MIKQLYSLNPVLLAVLFSTFAWFTTLLGSSLVFLFKKPKKIILNIMLAVSGGIMLSASFWSLLNPAITFSEELHLNPWLMVSLGLISGSIFLLLSDKIYNVFYKNNISSYKKRNFMLFLSITLHNIPEGLVVGVAFGALSFLFSKNIFLNAVGVAIGIAIQNFPEGCAISLPMKRDGYSSFKSFFIGQLSAIVEPISAFFGALLVTKVKYSLPFLLSFAAGAMIHVVVKDLIPESQKSNTNLITFFTIIGFIIMSILDISLG